MTFTQDWFSHNIPNWEKFLVPIFKDEPVRALELGSFEGRSAIWINDNLLTDPHSTLLCVDSWSNPKWKVTFDHNTKAYSKIASVQSPAVQFLCNNFHKFDFVYIDADHYAKSVLLQAQLIWPYLNKGGVLIFDDYQYRCEGNDSPPKAGIDAFLNIYEKELSLLHLGSQAIILKL